MSNRNNRLPMKLEPVSPPAPIWQQAAPVVARGVALVAAGVIGEWLLRSATRKAVSMPFQGRKSRAVARQAPADSGIIAISETVTVRRTIVRRS